MVFGLSSTKSGRIKLLDEIGSGSYAKVYSCKCAYLGNSESKYYAAKVINTKIAPKDFLNKFLPRELEICKQINHEHVVTTYDIVKEKHRIILLMDYASRGDLLSLCRLFGALPDSRSKPMFRQLVLGLEYLHDLGIIHRDLKCENILLCHDDKVMIADLGFARYLTDQMVSKTFCGSAAYAAPELLKGQSYSGFAPDIWSLGCILFVLGCHMMPFRDETVRILISDQKRPPKFPRQLTINPVLKLFIGELLTYDSSKRPNIKQVKSSSWLSK